MGPRIDRVDKSGGTVVATAEDQMKDMLNSPRLRENTKIAELVKIIAKMPDTERRLIHYWLKNNIEKGRAGRDALNAWMDTTSNPTLNRAIDDVPQLSFLIGDRIKKTGDSTVLTRLTSQKKIDVLELALDDMKVDAKGAQGLTSAFSAMTPKEKNKVIDDMQRRNPDELPNFLKMSAAYIDHILLDGINKENAAFIRKTYQYLEAHATTQQDKDLYGKISHFMEGWLEEAYKRR
ncbi:hypothetical protein L0152_24215 [bacterium]|nr:hypothetical protein [bacterium]